MKMYWRRTFFVIAGLSAAACSGSDAPTVPSESATAPRQCRTHTSAYAIAIVSPPNGDRTGSGTCTFDARSLTLRCTETTDSSFGCNFTFTRTDSYASVLDFVEEGAAVGRRRYLRAEFVNSGCTSGTASHVNTYDAQKRILRHEVHMNGRPFSIANYTAWDAHGRPTALTAESDVCSGDTYAIAYDDAARTVTETPTGFGPASQCRPFAGTGVSTYDANGNLVRYVSTRDGSVTYSTTTTVNATAGVCL